MQVTNTTYEHIPILGLRGGGSDTKRKEARKKRFGQRLSGVSPYQLVAEMSPQGAELDTRPREKQKEDAIRSESSERGSTNNREDPGTESHRPQNAQDESSKSHRFIVFIGNLPFSATDQSIWQHFAKVKPRSIRHRTQKDTGKSKGFAFLEFQNYDRMKTCLKAYHHSTFHDGKAPPRKLNVELTVGGGGSKSKDRRLKLHAKNESLNEERKRRVQDEKQGNKTKDLGTIKHTEMTKTNSSIHPSRRSRVAND